jgi:hypothetical protein
VYFDVGSGGVEFGDGGGVCAFGGDADDFDYGSEGDLVGFAGAFSDCGYGGDDEAVDEVFAADHFDGVYSGVGA